MAKCGGFGRSRFNRDRFNRGGDNNRRDFGGRGGGGGGGGVNRGGNNNGSSRDNFNNKGNYGRPNAYEAKDVPMKDNYGNNRDNFGRDRDRTDIHSSGRSRFTDIPKTENPTTRFSNHADSSAGTAGPRSGASRFQSGGGSRFSNNDSRAPPSATDSYQNRSKDEHSNSFYDTSAAKYNRPPPAISSAVTQSNSGYQSQSNQYSYSQQGDTSRPPPPSSSSTNGNYQYGSGYGSAPLPAMYAFPPPPLPTK